MKFTKQYILQAIALASNNLRLSSDRIETVALLKDYLHNCEDIETEISKGFKNSNHSIEIISSFNNLIPEITDVIDREEIDFVIMGTKGATGAKEVLFGSNTVHVFKNTKCLD